MLELLATWFVHEPVNILLVAGVILVIWGILRFGGVTGVRRPNALVLPIACWLVYALWERLVMTRTPEANIRVDLLVIWPLLGIVSLCRPRVPLSRSYGLPEGM